MYCNPEIAYVIGLIATDGYLSKDRRHIEFASKDLELVEKFEKILKLENKISVKSDGKTKNIYYRIQFGNVKFYKYLNGIGIENNKSKTINKIAIHQDHLEWIREELYCRIKIKGSLTKGSREYCLRFAKSETLKLFYKMYYDNNLFFLQRKYVKIKDAINII
ncbi:MAG: LAGLIDADG family homing endonuclease [Candidatus Pacebacteria bacterium]|nr:LAGLIDADG family homing endonuclease [Candidatus Paceibacterota bacterium]